MTKTPSATSGNSLVKKYLPFLSSILGFIIFFGAINLFQYYRVKEVVSTSLLESSAVTEHAQVESFFTQIVTKLNIVREWGKNGVLNQLSLVDLNKKFVPLIQDEPHINSLIYANDSGQEYFLLKAENNFVTRTTNIANSQSKQTFKQWHSVEQQIKEWSENSDYDPRQRPWFVSSSLDEVYVSNIYTFYQSKKEGITASVSWHDPTSKKLYVFGLDILLENIDSLLASINQGNPVITFLVSTEEKTPYVITSIAKQLKHQGNLIPNTVETVLPEILNQWVANTVSSNAPIELQKGSNKWVAAFKPIFEGKGSTWIGAISTEKALMTELDSSAFQRNLPDLFFSFLGSLLLYFITFRLNLRKKPYSPPAPLDRVLHAINIGEGEQVEFKSTIRTNLKSGKQGKEIELAWLKAITAFLNSQGGTLLLGINDQGEAEGLEADGFENDDKCFLHVKNLINQHIGAEFSSFITLTLVYMAERPLLLIEVSSSKTPVVLRIGKNEEFYIRSGPSSTKLTPSQMIHYVLQEYKK